MSISRTKDTISQLLITPSYVPIDTSVCLINAKLTDALLKHDVETIVLTMSPEGTSLPVNTRLLDIFRNNRRVYRVRPLEKGGKPLNVFRKIIRKIFPFLFYIPDRHFIWTFLSLLKLFQIRRECKIDILHSVSAPYCSHIVGYVAKRILKKPWICHLDDFWIDQTQWAPHFFDEYRFINVWIEKMCFRKADIILSTSKEILQLAQKRYPQEVSRKFLFIPPCYEPQHYPGNHMKRENSKYTFTYLGKFYPNRREPFPLFSALKLIKRSYPQLYKKLEVKLIGLNCAEYQAYVNQQLLDDVVKCEPQVDYLESMSLMKEAAILVHFGYIIDRRKEDIFVSGKLFEYLGAERLILSITRPIGPVASFTRENKGIVCDYNDAEDIAEKIIQIVSTYSIDDLYQWESLPHVKQLYSSESVAVAYKKLFQSLIADGKSASK